MPTLSKFVVAMLILMGLLLAGCDSVAGGGGGGPGCDFNYDSLLEKSWTPYSQTPLPAWPDPTKAPEAYKNDSKCVVLYRVDRPRRDCNTDGKGHCPNIGPVLGAVFRKDLDRSRNIREYDLKLPNDMYLGEHNVIAYLKDVLSGLEGQELVIEDRDAENVVVQINIFLWQGDDTDSAKNAYKSRGWFLSNAGLTLEQDKLTTLDRLWGTRSQLAVRRVYVPRDTKNSYYVKEGNTEDMTRRVDPQTVDLISLEMPEDQNLVTTEYPEKLLLALYERLPIVYTDTAQLHDWMSPDALASWVVTDTQVYGCLVKDKLTKVYVQDVDVGQSPGIPAHLDQQDYTQTDKVVIKALCRFSAESKKPDEQIALQWPVRWDWKVEARIGKWQLLKPAPK